MIALLISSAIILGLLAFFEPCTIATHTLFSKRVHEKIGKGSCCHNLFSVWISRTLLLVSIFIVAVMLTDVPQWGPLLPSLILAIISIVYVASRFIYLPVPHLEFFKLIPYAKKLPFSIRLGLTLPACTLLLVVVVLGLVVTVNSIPLGILSGILFASFFTLPMIIVSYKGLNNKGLELLNRASIGSPYLTAVLLMSAAITLLIPALNINVGTLKAALEHASWAGIGIGFLTGFVFSFNPVSFASVPMMLAYVTKAHEERGALIMGGAFVLGMLLTHVSLGVIAALGGEWVKSVMGREWGIFLGPLLIIMGLMWAGVINIRLRWFGIKGHTVTGVWGAFLLGIPFSIAVCPFCTPALLVALTASASIGSPLFGFALLLAFALGRSIPIILGAWSMGWLESLQMLTKYQKLFELVAGITLILTGLYLLNEYFFIIRY